MRKIIGKIVFILVLLYGGITFANQQIDMSNLNKKASEWESRIADENRKTPQLEEERKNVNTDEYKEQKAREMGYVRSNETVYYDVNKAE